MCLQANVMLAHERVPEVPGQNEEQFKAVAFRPELCFFILAAVSNRQNCAPGIAGEAR